MPIKVLIVNDATRTMAAPETKRLIKSLLRTELKQVRQP